MVAAAIGTTAEIKSENVFGTTVHDMSFFSCFNPSVLSNLSYSCFHKRFEKFEKK